MTQQDWRVKTALLKHRLSKFNPHHDSGTGQFTSGPIWPQDHCCTSKRGCSVIGTRKARTKSFLKNPPKWAVNVKLPFPKKEKDKTPADRKADQMERDLKVLRAAHRSKNVSKFNPHHDSGTGQFTSGPGGGGGQAVTTSTKPTKVTIKQEEGFASTRHGTARREVEVKGEIVGQVSQKRTRWGPGAWRLTLTDPDKKAAALEAAEAIADRERGYKVKGRRIEPDLDFLSLADVREAVAAAFDKESITKFNPYHDELGRFSSGPGGGVSQEVMDANFKEEYGQERRDGDGDCFSTANRLAMQLGRDEEKYPNLKVAHGVPMGAEGTPIDGVRFHHGWVEYDDPDTGLPMVIDKSNGNDVEMPAFQYYMLGEIEEWNVNTYTPLEVTKHQIRTRHHGPWE